MKKLLFLGIFSLLITSAIAKNQIKLNEYKASNGVTYKVGDTIKLARGSGTNGTFVYVTTGTRVITGTGAYLSSMSSGLIVTIEQIIKFNYKHYKGVFFFVDGGWFTTYSINIENAIAVGEIQSPNNKKMTQKNNNNRCDKYDELMKIKKLLDQGVLTKEEFEAEKKKTLEEKNKIY